MGFRWVGLIVERYRAERWYPSPIPVRWAVVFGLLCGYGLVRVVVDLVNFVKGR